MLHFRAFLCYLMVIPLQFVCAQRKRVMLQQRDLCESVMFLVQLGHVYRVCGPGLVSMSPVSVSGV